MAREVESLAMGLRPEGFAWRLGRDSDGEPTALICGADDRGALYAIHDLCERIGLARGWPEASAGTSNPFFPVRRWSIAISRLHRRPWDDRRTLWDGLDRVRRIMALAPNYGVNSIELNGRPGDGFDPDWLLAYRHYPQFRATRSVEASDDSLLLLEETARSARDLLLDLYVWSHELYVPPEFFALFPETKGVDYDLCTSHPLVQRFIYDRYAELFEGAPHLAGVVLSVTESGHFSLITDAGCQCDHCRHMSRSDRLLAVLTPVYRACRDYGKTLVARTFQAAFIKDLDSHPELDIIREAFSHLPGDVYLMSKYCPQDFYGTEIVDEPLIGAFANPHLVEFSLDREWSGRTFIPVLTPDDFQKRLRHAVEKGVVGTVARVDFPFPEMEPEEIFTHFNEFNAYVFGKLSWDPNYDLDQAWQQWGLMHYGAEAAPAVTAALKHTELASERVFFVKGVTVVNYHNMIAALEHSLENLWARAPSKWEPEKRWLTDKFFHPDEDFIREVASSPLEACREAEAALQQLADGRDAMPPAQYLKLRNQLEVMRDAGALWSRLNELFFRYVAWQDHDQLPSAEEMAKSLEAAQGVIRQALAMERRHGLYSWPVFSPDRGISAYEFVEQVWCRYLSTYLGVPVPEFVITRWSASFWYSYAHDEPGHERQGFLALWLDCLEAARRHWGYRSNGRLLNWPPEIEGASFASEAIDLHKNGAAFPLPVGLPIQGPSIPSGNGDVWRVCRTEEGLGVELGHNWERP
ncbi:MAG: hypothetical protein HPY83_11030 [Anaerolineae bacterium]|nr:hypothetical protein [Anaerolineae bacterium]